METFRSRLHCTKFALIVDFNARIKSVMMGRVCLSFLCASCCVYLIVVARASGMAVVCTHDFAKHSFAVLGVCVQRWLHDRQFSLFSDFASRVKYFDVGRNLFSSVQSPCSVRSSDCLSD